MTLLDRLIATLLLLALLYALGKYFHKCHRHGNCLSFLKSNCKCKQTPPVDAASKAKTDEATPSPSLTLHVIHDGTGPGPSPSFWSSARPTQYLESKVGRDDRTGFWEKDVRNYTTQNTQRDADERDADERDIVGDEMSLRWRVLPNMH